MENNGFHHLHHHHRRFLSSFSFAFATPDVLRVTIQDSVISVLYKESFNRGAPLEPRAEGDV